MLKREKFAMPRAVTCLAAPFIKGRLLAKFGTFYRSGHRTVAGEAVGSFMPSKITLFSKGRLGIWNECRTVQHI
jgi:hypothetical protein